MNKFDETYFKILHQTKSLYNDYLNNKPICLYESIKLIENDIIVEMNNNVFPIPKDLLSFYVKEILENGFYYVFENSMKNVINMINSSDNFNILKINMKKVNQVKHKYFLMICLPYKKETWQKELKEYFQKNEIDSIFEKMNDKNGAFGTYHSGFLIILKADVLKCLKDIEVAVEHEFILMFEDINGDTYENSDLSDNIRELLGHPSEFNTYTVNLMNRLDKIYDKYCIKINLKDDNLKERKEFLDKMFSLVKRSPSPEYLTIQIQNYYDDSILVGDNMIFFWNMLHWKTKEFEKFKQNIYDHFLK